MERKSHREIIDGWHPFAEYEIAKYVAKGYWQDQTVCDLLDRNAEAVPDKLAVADDTKEVTWKELQTGANRVALHLKRRRYIEQAQKKIQSSRLGYHLAQGYYEKGQEMLSQNKMNEALDYYTWIIQNSRESLTFPYSLYQIAKIHSIQRESKLALQEFNLIINQFPLSDLYDKSLKATLSTVGCCMVA